MPVVGSTWVHVQCKRPVTILRVVTVTAGSIGPGGKGPVIPASTYVEYCYPRGAGRGPGGFHRTKAPAQQLAIDTFLEMFRADAPGVELIDPQSRHPTITYTDQYNKKRTVKT